MTSLTAVRSAHQKIVLDHSIVTVGNVDQVVLGNVVRRRGIVDVVVMDPVVRDAITIDQHGRIRARAPDLAILYFEANPAIEAEHVLGADDRRT